MYSAIKNFFKKYFYILKVRNRFTPAVRIAQRQLFHYYRDGAMNGKVPAITDTGFSVFSQYEEDGILLFIFAVIGTAGKTFVDIGSNDGINSNCANLAINFDWHGLFIDGDTTAINRGKYFYKKYPSPWAYPQKFVCENITTYTVNDVIKNAGFSGEVDLLSIDIDGNDYFIWKALEIIKPRVVVIETLVEFGNHNIVFPYKPNKPQPYQGASPAAMNELAKNKGYRLVGTNNYGHNAIYVRNDLGVNLIPEVTVASTLLHPSAVESFIPLEKIKGYEYFEG